MSLQQDELPLVENLAPDFDAEAVFYQEFIKVVLKRIVTVMKMKMKIVNIDCLGLCNHVLPMNH